MALSKANKRTGSKAAAFLAAVGTALKRHYRASRL
jgi:hypothetical protein